MRNFSTATAEQNPASPRISSARRLGYVCLVLMALVSRDAFAQKPGAIDVTVTLLPGETARTIVAPTGGSFVGVALIASEEHLCNLPSAAQINAQLANLAAFGRLQAVLTLMEGAGTASAGAIQQAFGVLFPANKLIASRFSRGTEEFSISQMVDGPHTLTFASNCLTATEAKTAINDIRRIIRAHLGMPAPTN